MLLKEAPANPDSTEVFQRMILRKRSRQHCPGLLAAKVEDPADPAKPCC